MLTMNMQALLIAGTLGAGALALALDDDAAAVARRTAHRAAVGYDGSSTLVLQVKDLESSIEWYREKLGFELIFVADSMPFAEVQSPVGGLAVGLSQRPEPATEGPAVTFGVEDVGAARAALEATGVAFDGDTVVHEGLVKLAYFRDPSGNQLLLHESLMDGGR